MTIEKDRTTIYREHHTEKTPPKEMVDLFKGCEIKYSKELVEHIQTSINEIQGYAKEIDDFMLEVQKEEISKDFKIFTSPLNVVEKIQPLCKKIQSNLDAWKESKQQLEITKNIKEAVNKLYEELATNIIGSKWDFEQETIKTSYDKIIECLQNINNLENLKN